jgi:hypothetical protein
MLLRFQRATPAFSPLVYRAFTSTSIDKAEEADDPKWRASAVPSTRVARMMHYGGPSSTLGDFEHDTV